jgi:hypothetical protein
MRAIVSIVLILSGLFLVFAILSTFVDPGKHATEPYDEVSADLAGDKAARAKLEDGSSCFSVLGETHDVNFRLAQCLAARMRGWREVVSITCDAASSADDYLRKVTALRRSVDGIPPVLDEESRPLIVAVGCPGQGRQYLGDLHDLMEIAVSLHSGPDSMTIESLKKECK